MSSSSILGSFTGFLDDILSDFSPHQNPLFSASTKTNTSSTSGSETNQYWETKVIDDRRKKRMLSNRESARRSRMRKQKHLENLKNQVTRYSNGNQELMNRLRFVNHNGHMIHKENQRLQLESVILQQKLSNLRRLMVSPELHNPLLASACMAMH